MDATAIVAIYAAVVATGALCVQAAQWHSARTQLRVEANAGVALVASGERDGWGQEITERGEVLFVQLTNSSPHAVKITHVGLQTVGRKDRKGLLFYRPYPLQLELPFEIPARNNTTLWQPRSKLEAWEARRLRVVVQTAAGDSFESRRFRLDDLRRLEIAG